MQQIQLAHPADFDGWRNKARALLHDGTPPEDVVWLAGLESGDLFGDISSDTPYKKEIPTQSSNVSRATFSVPHDFIRLSQYVVCHNEPTRFALLYRILWRMTHGEPDLLKNPCDDDVHRAHNLRRSVSRDRHKMTAFVRFRKLANQAQVDGDERTSTEEPERYIAWFEPDHHILRLTSDFFMKRFTNMNWSIYTPEDSAHWNGERIVFGAGSAKDTLPDAEGMENLWRSYFANTFNPARLRIDAMQSEMPVKYWKNLPEAPLIAELIHNSHVRTQSMLNREGTSAPKFAEKAVDRSKSSAPLTEKSQATSLIQLAKQVSACELCEHASKATQSVFGQFQTVRMNTPSSRVINDETGTIGRENQQNVVMIVGEQPGDTEDLSGLPFQGPAGTLLRHVLQETAIEGWTLYFTNAVKHFKYSVKGKRRLHARPTESSINNCRPWLIDEIRLIQPQRIVALGRSAAKSLQGYDVSINGKRGTWERGPFDVPVFITNHPSAILRTKDQDVRKLARRTFEQDLQTAFVGRPEHKVSD